MPFYFWKALPLLPFSYVHFLQFCSKITVSLITGELFMQQACQRLVRPGCRSFGLHWICAAIVFQSCGKVHFSKLPLDEGRRINGQKLSSCSAKLKKDIRVPRSQVNLQGQRAEIVVSVSLCFDSWLRASYVEFTYLSRAFLFLCTPASI